MSTSSKPARSTRLPTKAPSFRATPLARDGSTNLRSTLLVFAILGLSPAVVAASAFVFEAAYTAETLAVVTGGLKHGAAHRGLLEASAEADLTVFGAPSNTRFRLSALAPHGGDFSGTHLGDLQGASNIAAHNHPLLYELWFAGEILGGRLALRAGRLVADSDFATTESGGVFLNSSFGWPAFISANTLNTGPAFNRSALGLFARLELTSSLSALAGLYDGDSFDDAGGNPARYPDGLRFELGHGQGTFAIGEIVLDTTAGTATSRRPGAFKLGVWRHTARFADQSEPDRHHSGNHGLYVVAEQMLWRESGPDPLQGLTAFARTGFSPGDRSRFAQTADAGVSRTGLFPGRDADVFGLGVAWARISQGRAPGCSSPARSNTAPQIHSCPRHAASDASGVTSTQTPATTAAARVSWFMSRAAPASRKRPGTSQPAARGSVSSTGSRAAPFSPARLKNPLHASSTHASLAASSTSGFMPAPQTRAGFSVAGRGRFISLLRPEPYLLGPALARDMQPDKQIRRLRVRSLAVDHDPLQRLGRQLRVAAKRESVALADKGVAEGPPGHGDIEPVGRLAGVGRVVDQARPGDGMADRDNGLRREKKQPGDRGGGESESCGRRHGTGGDGFIVRRRRR